MHRRIKAPAPSKVRADAQTCMKNKAESPEEKVRFCRALPGNLEYFPAAARGIAGTTG